MQTLLQNLLLYCLIYPCTVHCLVYSCTVPRVFLTNFIFYVEFLTYASLKRPTQLRLCVWGECTARGRLGGVIARGHLSPLFLSPVSLLFLSLLPLCSSAPPTPGHTDAPAARDTHLGVPANAALQDSRSFATLLTLRHSHPATLLHPPPSLRLLPYVPLFPPALPPSLLHWSSSQRLTTAFCSTGPFN